MTLRKRVVTVKQLPEKSNLNAGRAFYRELDSAMNVERPCIVLDCARAREMDQQTILMLLNCLEGAMKRNGDVRLAAISPAAHRNLEATGVDRLFRTFATVEEAVNSFHHRTVTFSSNLPRAEANAA